jgi:hypothetical protein
MNLKIKKMQVSQTMCRVSFYKPSLGNGGSKFYLFFVNYKMWLFLLMTPPALLSPLLILLFFKTIVGKDEKTEWQERG